MNTPRNILVPVDFSECSKLAIDYAVALAARLDAKIHFINVLFYPVNAVPEVSIAMPPDVIDSLVAGSQRSLDQLVEPHRGKANIGETRIRIGDPRDEILHTAEQLGADLIVMGTHGRRGLKRALLGSVAELVVRTASCPVLTVRSPKK